MHTIYNLFLLCHVLRNLTGQAGGSSTAPCPYCERTLTIHTSLLQQLTCGRLRSCNKNRAHFRALCAAGDMSNHKKFASCVADPIDIFPQDDDIISWCRIPQLHCHLFINWFLKQIAKYIDIDPWNSHFHQTRSNYHNHDFDGPQLYRLTRSDGTTHFHFSDFAFRSLNLSI